MKVSLRLFVFLSLILFTIVSTATGGDFNSLKFADGSIIPALTDNKAYMSEWPPLFSTLLLQTDQVGTIYSNLGLYGVGFNLSPLCDGERCPSFESPAGSDLEYLFGGAIWIGGIVGSDTLVTIGTDGWYYSGSEFFPPEQGRYFDGPGDQSAWTVFNDTVTDINYIGIDPYDGHPHIPLNVQVANRAYVWNTDPEHNLVIHDMVITNIGQNAIHDGYIGFYFDADVYHLSNQAGGFQDDIAGALRDECIGYIIDNDGDPYEGAFDYRSPTRLFAFKFLSTSFDAADTNFNWWISNGNAALDFGPRLAGTPEDPFRPFNAHLGTPTGDPNKYYILSHKEFDYDQCAVAISHEDEGFLPPPLPSQAADFADGFDARFLMSIGPFNLEPDSSIRILFTTFTGENVHHVVDNMDNLPFDPDQYLANLDFSDVLNNAAAADLIAPLVINPDLPPIGLRTIFDSRDSVVVEWDPYGFNGITGYDIFLYKVPTDSLPYPDIVPPWLELDDLSVMEQVDNSGMYFRYTFDTLSPGHFYFASVANHTSGGPGDRCQPIIVRPGGRIAAPVPGDKYLFIRDGDMAAIRWSEPAGVDVDHYNIYRLAMSDTVPGLFYPFYDTGEFGATAAPVDSFFREAQWYYYYAMGPYAQTDSGVIGLSDYADDSTLYYITAVDKAGLESSFSDEIAVFVLDPYDQRDILVMNCRNGRIQVDRVECDSLEYFYDYVLGGSYDRYDMPETLTVYGGVLDPDWWRDLIPYRVVIVDGGLEAEILSTNPFFMTVNDFEKYIQSGGKLAFFGSLTGLTGSNINAAPHFTAMHPYWFSERYFGIDSVFQIGLIYYYNNSSPPFIDTLTGLTGAIPELGGLPSITYNPLVNGPGIFSQLWPAGTAPSPSAFTANENGTVLYRAETMYPSTSRIDNQPVGIKTEVAGTATYLFGFHLWYMDPDAAALLVDYILNDSPFEEGVCGDANGDGLTDIGDAVFLINYIFRYGFPPAFPDDADANGDGIINLGDIVYLVNYIFRGGSPPACE